MNLFCVNFVLMNKHHLPVTILSNKPLLLKGAEQVFNLTTNFCFADRTNLPESVRNAPDLVKNYKLCLESGNTDKARRLLTDISRLVFSEVDTTAKEMRKAGDKFRNVKRYLDSIPFLFASVSLDKRDEDGKRLLEEMKWCIWRMSEVSKGMSAGDVSLQRVVKSHLIPLMREIMEDMKNTEEDEEAKVDEIIWALRWISESEAAINEFQSAEAAHNERLILMRGIFGDEADKREHFGVILKELGDLHAKAFHFVDAKSCYEQAIQVFRTTTDVDEEGRDELTKACEELLRGVQHRIE